jgi:hypothetical protein
MYIELPATSTKLMVKKTGNIAKPFQGSLAVHQILFRFLVSKLWPIFDRLRFGRVFPWPAGSMLILAGFHLWPVRSGPNLVRFSFNLVSTLICSEQGFPVILRMAA